ncbi:MAG: FtsX-like permease family protein [Oscillospiraceae bacterium]|nr:FtsX-like permease family protein [Oscillospiraceae bacterium]
MVKTLFRSAFREIRQSMGRYLAILAIVGLGVGFFAGLRICQPDMMATGQDYIARQELFDFQLLSTLGFTQEDVDSFAGMEGVAQARGAVSADFLTEIDGQEVVVRAHSLTGGVNVPQVKAGRMPEAPNECLADARYLPETVIGAALPVTASNDEDTRELLRYDSYTVVGLAWSPYYLNYERGTSSIGSGSVASFVYIPEEGFDFEAYYEIFLTMDGPEAAYTDGYQAQLDAIKPAVETLTSERAELRYDTLYSDAMDEISDAEREVADGWSDYHREKADAEQELADAYQELTDGEADYEQGQRDYEQGQVDYADGQRKVADALRELEDARQEVADGERELADARKELDDGWADYYQAKADAEQELADALQKLNDGERDYADGLREYNDGLADYNDGERELAEAADKVAEAEKEVQDGERQLRSAEIELETAWYKLQSGRAALDENQATLDALGAQLDSGEAEIASAEAQLSAGLQQIDAAEAAGFMTAEAAAAAKAPLLAQQAALGQQKAQLQAGRAQYETGRAQLAAGWAEYRSGYASYQNGEAQVSAARRELESGKEELEKGRKELEDGRKELADAKEKLDEAQQELADARKELDDGWLEYNDGKATADRELADALQKLNDGEAEYADGLRELEDGRQKLADGERELADARRELNDAQADLEKAPGELADARKELDDGWLEYNDGRADADREFADAEEELLDAEQKLADARADLAELKHPTTYVLTREENTGYVCFDNDTSIIKAVSVVFPVFFFLVAALVCMTTMTRMVDEQRTQIGVLKALGYSNAQIMAKYLFYSGTAALAGSAVGFVLGSIGLPWVIWEIYGMIYGFAPLEFVTSPALTVLSFAAALACSMGATWYACRVELGRQASELIRPKAPRAGKRVFLEYVTPVWKRLSFLKKVSVRNVLRYRSRLIMMVLGIGGCTALLCTGFGIRDSIAHVADDQFDEITLYDYAVTFQDPQDQDSIQAYLDGYGWDAGNALLAYSGGIDILNGSGSKSIYCIISSTGSLDGFLSLHSGETPLPYPGPGEVVLNVGLAQAMDIAAGDTVTLRDDEKGSMEVTVSAICDNYVFNYVYISEETYQTQLGEAPEYNTLYLLAHEGADPYKEGALLLEDDSVAAVTVNADTRSRVDSMLSRLDYIVLVVVLCAAALAFIVLYNLTNINITERIREIATIKVLGFYQNEVASYVFREITILSVLGALVGMGMGKALHLFVMEKIKIDSMFFASRISPLSYLISVALTLLFTTVISLGMRPRLRKIDMAESLKSIE